MYDHVLVLNYAVLENSCTRVEWTLQLCLLNLVHSAHVCWDLQRVQVT
jgi:hypothetical protein